MNDTQDEQLLDALRRWADYYLDRTIDNARVGTGGKQLFLIHPAEKALYESLPLNCKRFIDPFIAKKKSYKGKRRNRNYRMNNKILKGT